MAGGHTHCCGEKRDLRQVESREKRDLHQVGSRERRDLRQVESREKRDLRQSLAGRLSSELFSEQTERFCVCFSPRCSAIFRSCAECVCSVSGDMCHCVSGE